ncbi:MAG: hypothetical protein SFX74_01665, partial [Fimbriimonadaceae bacterium]|nr:hypothetical protein [Fimbriimonadaceae bacterium]
MAETRKAHPRRQHEGFYAAYCQGQGIDIGVGRIDTFDGVDAQLVTGQAWEFETAVRNNQNLGPNNRWALLDYGSSGSSGLPFIGGEPADPARAP